jgi:phosphoribosyl-AMP cyclohydrolase / phosphoribosyl-ATP pyrophosphohydrolase
MSSAMGAMASSRGVKTCVVKMDSSRSARGATARTRAQAPAQGSSMRRERHTTRTNAYRHAFATGEAMDEAALKEFLDGLKYDVNGFVVAIAQDVDTGAILMQGFADRTAVEYTLKNRKATFWSRSQKKLWTKGETSGNFIEVQSVHLDCDRDSLIYLGIPSGPTCHTGAHTCYYKRVDGVGGAAAEKDGGRHTAEEALTTLYELEATIEARRVEQVDDDAKPSWTRRLLDNPELLCKKIREEAGELCQTWEEDEGKQAATNEMADVLYHSMVMLNKQGVPMSDVLAVLRQRFGTSGVAEKASRAPKK